jgi:DNA-binding MarR family transcriptional regulator
VKSPSKKASEASVPLDLAGFLPYRLSVLANTLSRELAELYAARFGITIPQWRIIAVLGQHTDVSADFVCARTAMDRVTVSRAIAGLLARRLLIRRVSPSDRRCSQLKLSAAGSRIYAEIVPLARGYESALLAELAPAERDALTHALSLLEQR